MIVRLNQTPDRVLPRRSYTQDLEWDLEGDGNEDQTGG